MGFMQCTAVLLQGKGKKCRDDGHFLSFSNSGHFEMLVATTGGTQRETGGGQWLFYPFILLWPGWGCSALSVSATALYRVPVLTETPSAVTAVWLDAVICSAIKTQSQLLFS